MGDRLAMAADEEIFVRFAFVGIAIGDQEPAFGDWISLLPQDVMKDLEQELALLHGDNFLRGLLEEETENEASLHTMLRRLTEAEGPLEEETVGAFLHCLIPPLQSWLKAPQEQEAAFARLPSELRRFWPVDYADFVWLKKEKRALICQKHVGSVLEIVLEGAHWADFPGGFFETVRMGRNILYETEGGFGLDMFWQNKDNRQPKLATVYFQSASFWLRHYNYTAFVLGNEAAWEALPSYMVFLLSKLLVDRRIAFGEDELNREETALFPLAQALAGAEYPAFPASPESVIPWIGRLKSEAGDRAVWKMLRLAQKPKRYRLASWWRKQRADIFLDSPKGTYTAHWLIKQFQTAAAAYPPPVSPFEAELGQFREYMEKRLVIEGFTGKYPDFRRIVSGNKAQFFRFSEWWQEEGFKVHLNGGQATLDENAALAGVPFEEATVLSCRNMRWKRGFFYEELCDPKNPVYQAGQAPEQAEEHIRQACRVLDGKPMEKAYKKKHRIEEGWFNRVLEAGAIAALLAGPCTMMVVMLSEALSALCKLLNVVWPGDVFLETDFFKTIGILGFIVFGILLAVFLPLMRRWHSRR